MALDDAVVYRPCPRCQERMHRRNFGRYSGIVVDECSTCGTYFDAGELAGVLAFVRGGGLTLTERRNADEARRELEHRRRMAATPPAMGTVGQSSSNALLDAELELVLGFLRWLGRWVRRIGS
jgi:Zn-finger nucleic acid-binding protein